VLVHFVCENIIIIIIIIITAIIMIIVTFIECMCIREAAQIVR